MRAKKVKRWGTANISEIASEGVAVLIARAITRTTKKFLPFKINPICTRRGKWRLRVAPRLIKVASKRGKIANHVCHQGLVLLFEMRKLFSLQRLEETQTIRKSLKDAKQD